jgi:hypothetical protein
MADTFVISVEKLNLHQKEFIIAHNVKMMFALNAWQLAA